MLHYIKKSVSKNFAKFTGKHLHLVFSCKFCEIFRNTFLPSGYMKFGRHIDVQRTSDAHRV